MTNNQDQSVFWITNISDRNVSIGDLKTTIGPYQSINFLSSHHHFTIEELEKSLTSGSLYEKRDILKLRKVPPGESVFQKPPIQVYKGPRGITRVSRPIVKIDAPKYEELEFSDEKFALENLEASLDDVQKAVLPKKQ